MPEQQAPRFSFGIITDTHINPREADEGTDPRGGRNARTRSVIQELNQLSLAFVLHLGDIAGTAPALPDHPVALTNSGKLFEKLRHAMHTTAGNHDVGDKHSLWARAAEVTDSYHIEFEKHWGPTYSSFDHQGIHFIMLNTVILNSGIRRENEQRRWLEADLAAHRGQRIFIGMHYPLYIQHADETDDHYENIAEPARSWLLALLTQYEVEGVFTGHVHSFFYDQYRSADLYTLPAVGFTRADLSEVLPADEGKLGFHVVEIYDQGHGLHFIPLHEIDSDERPLAADVLPLTAVHSKQKAPAPVGVYLTRDWAEVSKYPSVSGNDQFIRKLVRNDYPVLALWGAGIRKLRVPMGDLADAQTRDRMAKMARIGHQFTVFSVGGPSPEQIKLLARNHKIVAAWEWIVPWRQVPEAITWLRSHRWEIPTPVFLSRLETWADPEGETSYERYAKHGFSLEQAETVVSLFAGQAPGEILDGLVIYSRPGDSPWQVMTAAQALAEKLAIGCDVRVGLQGSEDKHAIHDDDRAIAARVAETVATALALPRVEAFVDTFEDHTRGFYLRNGLVDPSYNPRPAYHVYRNLHRLWAEHFAGEAGELCEIQPVAVQGPMAAFEMASSRCRALLLLPWAETLDWQAEFEPPAASADQTQAVWTDLVTGRRQTVTRTWAAGGQGGGLILEPIPACRNPSLLVL